MKKTIIAVIFIGVLLLSLILFKAYKKNHADDAKLYLNNFKKSFNTNGSCSSHDGSSIGLWWNLPKAEKDKYTFALKVTVETKTSYVESRVELVDKPRIMPFGNGDPQIIMEIPASKIEYILKNGLPSKQKQILFQEAEKENWKWNPHNNSGKKIILKYEKPIYVP